MKRILFAILLLTCLQGYSQTTYYWVGGAGVTSFTSNTNWNTALDGSGTTRVTADPTDILIFNGSNIGGAVPATGTVTVTIASTTVGQLRLINNASLVFTRTGGGTGTVTVSGSGAGDDFIIESGSSLTINPTATDGTVVISLPASVTGLVAGTLVMTTGPHRIVAQSTGALVFANGASVTTSTTNYPFGSTSSTPIAVEKGVVFESGAHLYYNGGNSPMGNQAAFSAIDFRLGSTYHIRASSGTGSFLNTKSFGNIIIENNTNFTTDGPVFRIENFTITAGSSFTVHTSGNTVVIGNLTVDGSLQLPVAASTNILLMAGTSPQVISGSGTITVPNFIVSDNADVSLTRNITVNIAANVFGKINFNNSQVTGPGTFTARVNGTAAGVTGNLVSGSSQITGTVGTLSALNGLTISGAGIPPNTTVVSFSTGSSTINLSKPITASGTAVPLTFSSDTATLATAHPSGMDSTNGSVVVVGNKNFQSGTNYIINGATTWPFGVTSGSTNTYINSGFVEINAPVTVNRGVTVYHHLGVNGKMTLRPLDTVHVVAGAVINGSFSSSNYIATGYNPTTGVQSMIQYDGAAGAVTIPSGTSNYYLPVTITPTTSSDFTVAVFEGITANGMITGTPLTASQKQTVVNAVWNINRISGTGNADMQIGWQTPLEGSTFTTLPDTEIGLIVNTGSSWALPIGTGNNTANTATGNVSSFGSFSAGAVPPSQPFVFNPLPVKTYGDPDFNGGATSLNTTQPIIYSSNNTAVATIVGGNIHITGAGTATITASQATDGLYPAASVDQVLTVNPAALTITADNKTKFQGQVNPPLTVTYTGFVLGETAAVLLTAPVVTTTAVTGSAPGTYPITVSGATAANYTITFVGGTLTVQPKQNQTITFNALPTKTYGNADFAAGATSTNNTIPITYASSNTAVATVTGNMIHITGAGNTTITASQAGNVGYFPAADVSRVLTVNKANLTIRVRDTSRVVNTPNPTFTITYTGFVLGETASNLLTAPVATTTATELSAPGYYPITLAGATSNNYNIIYTNGRLTVLPETGTSGQHLNAYMSNPTTLTVRVYSPEPKLADITVYDFQGRPLKKKNLFMPVGFISTDIEVPTLPSGIYIVTVRGEGVDLKQTVPIIR